MRRSGRSIDTGASRPARPGWILTADGRELAIDRANVLNQLGQSDYQLAQAKPIGHQQVRPASSADQVSGFVGRKCV